MTTDQAADLAARTLAAIDANADAGDGIGDESHAVDRERVASDLAGLRGHNNVGTDWCVCETPFCPDAARYADGLRRTAALYGVTA